MFPDSVEIRDDTMREGLQIEDKDISVDAKLRLLDALGDTGLKTISIGSFVSPKLTPQMACIDEIAERFEPKPGVTYTAAVFNKAGFERADKFFPKVNVRIREFVTHVEVCQFFAMRNYNRTPEQMFEQARGSVERAAETGEVNGGVVLGNAFGSNFQEDPPLSFAMELLDRTIDLWRQAGLSVTRLQLIDDMGACMPGPLMDLITYAQRTYPEITDYGLHLHNQRGVTNICYYEALKLGVTRFDTSIGGMGGCPYCGNGRSAGHVPTEDFTYLCHELGIDTGLDLDKLIDAAVVAETVVGHPLHGHVSRAGPRPRADRIYAPDLPFIETLEEAQHFRKGSSACAHQLKPWKKDSALRTYLDQR